MIRPRWCNQRQMYNGARPYSRLADQGLVLEIILHEDQALLGNQDTLGQGYFLLQVSDEFTGTDIVLSTLATEGTDSDGERV